MKSTRLGCISGSGVIITLLALLAIAAVAATQGGVLFNPGTLSAQAGSQPLGGVSSHAGTGGRCSACHTAIWQKQTMTDRCLDCHLEPLSGKIDFHRVMLAQSQSWKCRDCHTDHNGAQASLTVLTLDRFPHDATGYSLAAHKTTSAGDEFTCTECHGEQIGSMDLARCMDCHRELDPLYMDDHLAAFGSD
ncbi:MAG: cytochrome c3 family protein, partial [Anaerolineales bacterium]